MIVKARAYGTSGAGSNKGGKGDVRLHTVGNASSNSKRDKSVSASQYIGKRKYGVVKSNNRY